MSVKYSEEFKNNAVRACMEEGITRTEVARRFDDLTKSAGECVSCKVSISSHVNSSIQSGRVRSVTPHAMLSRGVNQITVK